MSDANDLTSAEATRMRDLRSRAGKSYREISAITGRSVGAIHKVLAKGWCPSGKATIVRERGQDVDANETGQRFEEREDGTATSSVISPRPVRTIDDAVKAAGVDLNIWHVDHWECSQWTVGIKVRVGGEEEIRREQQYRVKLKLKRIMPKPLTVALDAIYARLAKHSIKYPTLPKLKKKGEEYLGVIGLVDAHFGKLAWAAETGENYDLKIAEQVYLNAVDDMIAEAAVRNVTKWVFPLGNDHVHIDGHSNATFNGTPQDVDGRYAKVIEVAEMAAIRAIERLVVVAPVHVCLVPGNHDFTSSYHIARTISAWFQRCSAVSVDYGPSPRKYIHWHNTLLGFTHGNEERIENLPNIMATERPGDWAASTCREWVLGHQHRSRKWSTKDVDSYEGTVVRVLRSLTATDAWHHRRGYVSGSATRAAEVYFYGKTRGYAGHAVVPARTDRE